MIAPARMALVTSAQGPDPSIAGLAMMAGLAAEHWRVQHFRSWARPTSSKLVCQATGRPDRNLDAWLMPPEVCRQVFLRGTRGCDLAIVEGSSEGAPPSDQVGYVPAGVFDRPGPLGMIAQSLELPRVLILDARTWGLTHLPYIPPETDAILLDHLEEPERLQSIRTMARLLARKPVIGAVDSLPEVRAAMASVPADAPVPAELITPLAESFLRTADLDAIRAVAGSRPWPQNLDDSEVERDLGAIVSACGNRGGFRVAYAMDEAFGAYFPDTLETLSALGAKLVEFSPLRDGGLPSGIDLVMIGCGCPDLHADLLASNYSLMSELQNHVCQGHRIYSEGGGTAYLARTMVLGDRVVQGAGIFPISAIFQPNSTGPTPVERTFNRDSWLGDRGTKVRGYRSGRWSFQPAADPTDCPAKSGPLTADRDVYFRKNAVGSLIHLHLGALPQVVAAFAGAAQAPIVHRPGR